MALDSDTKCICPSASPEKRDKGCPQHGHLASTQYGCDGYLTQCLCGPSKTKVFTRRGEVWHCNGCGAVVRFLPAAKWAAVEALPGRWDQEASRELNDHPNCPQSSAYAQAKEQCADELREALGKAADEA